MLIENFHGRLMSAPTPAENFLSKSFNKCTMHSKAKVQSEDCFERRIDTSLIKQTKITINVKFEFDKVADINTSFA